MPPTIADFISEDLRVSIRDARPLPSPLSLAQLAGHYNVSLTPVRQATQALVEEGVLTRLPNGRLSIRERTEYAEKEMPPAAPESDGEESTALLPPTPDLDDALIGEIIARSLHGDDEYLREEAWAKRCDVGRTTLRAAFNRLAGKGLLVHVPRRGWRVRGFDADDLQAYLTIRETLELAALDLARPHLDPADLHAMRQANALESSNTPALLNNDLHGYLIAKSGNRYLQDFFQQHGVYYAALFDYAAPETHVMDAMARQHQHILDALLAQDWETARQGLSEHIRAQYPIVQQLLTRLSTGA